jgi:hypothetical protein
MESDRDEIEKHDCKEVQNNITLIPRYEMEMVDNIYCIVE